MLSVRAENSAPSKAIEGGILGGGRYVFILRRETLAVDRMREEGVGGRVTGLGRCREARVLLEVR